MKKQYIALIALLIATQLYSIVKISSLESKLERVNRSIQNTESRVSNNISSIYNNIDEKLNQQASIIKSASYKFGTVDTQKLEIPINFEVTPKIIEPTTIVSLDINGNSLPLEKQGNTYVGKTDISIFANITPTIVIENNGVKQLEDSYNLYISDLINYVFPTLNYPHFSGSYGCYSNEFNIKGTINTSFDNYSKDVSFVSLRYITKINDKTIDTKDILVTDEQNISLDIDDKFPLKDEEILTTYISATDNLGFTHEALLIHFIGGNNMQREPHYGEFKIYSPTGELIYDINKLIKF